MTHDKFGHSDHWFPMRLVSVHLTLLTLCAINLPTPTQLFLTLLLALIYAHPSGKQPPSQPPTADKPTAPPFPEHPAADCPFQAAWALGLFYCWKTARKSIYGSCQACWSSETLASHPRTHAIKCASLCAGPVTNEESITSYPCGNEDCRLVHSDEITRGSQ